MTTQRARWRTTSHRIIFGTDTVAGRRFDVALMVMILASVATIVLESVRSVREQFGTVLQVLEWFFTVAFTIEYVLRIASAPNARRYALSAFGLIDLLAILPSYLSVVFPGSQYFLSIRTLRLLRVFRVLKLTKYLSEAEFLSASLLASRRKISVFLTTVLMLVVTIGSLMYMIEGEENGFNDIPTSIYWAIVTLTTVGYGDLSPHTATGKVLASVVMIMGYAIIAVPTGIVTAEMAHTSGRGAHGKACPVCAETAHDTDADYCKRCGAKI